MKKKEEKIERNIVLLGFMGCGKSTTGIILSKRLGMKYVDVDKYIEEMTGRTIPELFAEGEDRFREEEHRAMSELAGQTGCVITTGGGVIMRDDNIPQMKENGVVVYINTPFSLCYQRIADSDRPLVHSNTREQLYDLYKLRRAKYRAVCDLEVPGINGSRPVVRAILAGLGLEGR